MKNVFCTVSQMMSGLDSSLCCLLKSLMQTQRSSQVPKCLKSHLYPSHLVQNLSVTSTYSTESFNKLLFAFIISCFRHLSSFILLMSSFKKIQFNQLRDDFFSILVLVFCFCLFCLFRDHISVLVLYKFKFKRHTCTNIYNPVLLKLQLTKRLLERKKVENVLIN